MNAPTNVGDGHLTIHLKRSAHGFEPTILSARPFDLPKLFVGQRVESAVEMIGLLFRLCRHAQLAAALTALEAACGMAVSNATSDARAVSVDLEAAREILMAVSGNDPETARSVMALEWRANQPSVWSLGGAAMEARTQHRILSRDLDALTRTIADGHQRCAAPDRVWANASPGFLTIDDACVAGRIASGPDSSRLAEAPDIDGEPRETGPVALLGDRELAQSSDGRRKARRLWLGRLTRRIAERDGSSIHVERGVSRAVAVVETARGLLAHSVVLAQDGTIAGYRITAPTEWNFHPDGVAVRALRALPASADPEPQARAIVSLVDPCVPFTIRNDAVEAA